MINLAGLYGKTENPSSDIHYKLSCDHITFKAGAFMSDQYRRFCVLFVCHAKKRDLKAMNKLHKEWFKLLDFYGGIENVPQNAVDYYKISGDFI